MYKQNYHLGFYHPLYALDFTMFQNYVSHYRNYVMTIKLPMDTTKNLTVRMMTMKMFQTIWKMFVAYCLAVVAFVNVSIKKTTVRNIDHLNKDAKIFLIEAKIFQNWVLIWIEASSRFQVARSNQQNHKIKRAIKI